MRWTIRPTGHIICTLTISGFLYFIFRSATAFWVSFLSGILMDIDHILDYYIQKKITLRMRKIYLWHIKNDYDFLFLYLHSLELVVMLWVAIFVFKLGIFWIALAIGMTQHIILDIFFNPIYTYAYLFLYRLAKGFKKEYILKSTYLKNSWFYCILLLADKGKPRETGGRKATGLNPVVEVRWGRAAGLPKDGEGERRQ